MNVLALAIEMFAVFAFLPKILAACDSDDPAAEPLRQPTLNDVLASH